MHGPSKCREEMAKQNVSGESEVREVREKRESIERALREARKNSANGKKITKLWTFDLSSFDNGIGIDIDGNFLFQTCLFITFVARGHFSPLLLTVAVANAAYDEHQAWNRDCRRP